MKPLKIALVVAGALLAFGIGYLISPTPQACLDHVSTSNEMRELTADAFATYGELFGAGLDQQQMILGQLAQQADQLKDIGNDLEQLASECK